MTETEEEKDFPDRPLPDDKSTISYTMVIYAGTLRLDTFGVTREEADNVVALLQKPDSVIQTGRLRYIPVRNILCVEFEQEGK